MVQANSITYRTLKRQIENDLKTGTLNYNYRLKMINTFDGKRITNDEANELREIIKPYDTFDYDEVYPNG